MKVDKSSSTMGGNKDTQQERIADLVPAKMFSFLQIEMYNWM
jgi:hypothetical protein